MRNSLVCVVVLLLSAGCGGSQGGDAGEGQTGPGGPGTGSIDQGLCSPVTPARIRRLSRTEYDRSVSELLGQKLTPSSQFPIDSQLGGYTNQADALLVTPLLAEALAQAASELSNTALGNLSNLVPCNPNRGDEGCARDFIVGFGEKAYRRPLEAEEVQGLLDVYAAGADFKSGIGSVLEVMFQSPNFVYRTELGDAASPVAGELELTGREIASELSYLVLGSPPDNDLVTKADAGELLNPSVREAEARRLLALPEARAQLSVFIDQWLGIDRIEQLTKDAGVYPGFKPEVARAMRSETNAFVQDVIFDGDGLLRTLLTANHTFADTRLARYYGLTERPAGLTRLTLDPLKSAGVLTQGSVLSTHAQSTQSSPVRRGKFVRVRLLCQELPQPPKDLMVMPPQPSTMNTTRERFKAHASGTCATCHSLIDPIGFAFEHFDGAGVYRTQENGFDIDASGELKGTKDANGTFNGVAELAQLLGESSEVRECFAKNWLQFAMARGIEKTSDACTLDKTLGGFKQGEMPIQELLVKVVTAGEFVRRAPQRQ